MQQVKEAPIDAGTAQLERSQVGNEATPPRKRDPAALWRALAGMAMSIALACLVVMLEFTGQAAHRADRMHRHADALLSRVSRLESEIAAERTRIAGAHREFAAAEALRALLRAPDAGMLLLVPPATPAATTAHRTAAAAARERPEATLALGPKEHRAILMVSGLKPGAQDAPFVLWWSAAHGAPIEAAEFHTAADGSALVTTALPPGLKVAAAMITAERAAKGGGAGSADGATPAAVAPAAHPASPTGPILLRGALAR